MHGSVQSITVSHGAADRVRGAIVSGSADFLAVMRENAPACIYRLSDQRRLRIPVSEAVEAVAFRSWSLTLDDKPVTGEIALAAPDSGKILRFDPAVEEFLPGMSFPLATAVAYSGDGNFIAAASADGHVAAWMIDDGQLSQALFGRATSEPIVQVALNANGSRVFAVSRGGAILTARVWSLEDDGRSTTPMHAIRNSAAGAGWCCRSLACHPVCEQMLIAGGTDQDLWLFDTSREGSYRVPSGLEAPIHHVSFAGESLLVAAGREGMRFWAVDPLHFDALTPLGQCLVEEGQTAALTAGVHQGEILSVWS